MRKQIFRYVYVHGTEFNQINERNVTNSKPIVIASKTFENNSDEEQQMPFKVEEIQEHSVTFEYFAGFFLKMGMKFQL